MMGISDRMNAFMNDGHKISSLRELGFFIFSFDSVVWFGVVYDVGNEFENQTSLVT